MGVAGRLNRALRNFVVTFPLYAAGVPIIRSLVWNVATIGIMLIVAGLLLG